MAIAVLVVIAADALHSPAGRDAMSTGRRKLRDLPRKFPGGKLSSQCAASCLSTQPGFIVSNKLSVAATLVARLALLVLLLASVAMAGILPMDRSQVAVERIDNDHLRGRSAVKAAAPGRERLRVPNGADVAALSAASENA